MARDNFTIPGYDAWKTRAPEDEPGYWDDKEEEPDDEEDEQLIQCEECGEEHPVDDCPESSLTADGEPRYRKVKCSRCGEPTTYDPTYGDLCYRHIRADNE